MQGGTRLMDSKRHPLPFLWHEGSPRVTDYDPQYYAYVYELKQKHKIWPAPRGSCARLQTSIKIPHTEHNHSYAWVDTRGLATPTASQHNIFDTRKNSQFCSCAPDGVRTSGLWIWSPTICRLSHPEKLVYPSLKINRNLKLRRSFGRFSSAEMERNLSSSS